MSRSLLALVVAVVASGCSNKPGPAPQVPAKPQPPSEPVAAGPRGVEPPQPTLRLPRNFVPTGYAARLDIDPAKTKFDGSIAITGVIDQTSSVIWLHGYKLKVGKATATKESSEIAITVTNVGEDLLQLRASKPLEAGEWTLMMDYAGELDTVSTSGAFKQVVADQSYVYTQLESIFARRVFPCVDEPDNKVPWKLTLDVPAKLVAVANTPITSEAPLAGDKRRVEFAQSKPLPTYLVAFGIGPFEIVDGGKTKGGTPVRIFTLAKRAADAAFAAKTSAKLLEITEEWFGIPYPYEKLDMLTIPVTVGFGAMENAGLITFTETLILIDPKNGSKASQNSWLLVAAHEIAHQWFGNLVTMAFWDDIWLNEGFANWLETKIVQKLDPSWHADRSELDMRNGALNADSLVSARQIRQPITTPDDILNAFDGITYNKGASILRMFENYVGPDVFQKGVRDYIASKAHGNATSADFAAAISKAAGKDVTAAFATFLDQAGAPQLTVTQSCAGPPVVSFAQARYLPVGAPAAVATKPWLLPVCIVYEKGGKRAEACTLVDEPTDQINLGKTSCPRWVMPNANGRGYYRVAYTTAQLATLRDVAWPELTWDERRAIFNDVVTWSGQGKVPLMLALSFVPKMIVGNDRFTMGPALGLPTGMDDWVPAELRPKFEYWLRTTFGAAALAAGLVPKDSDSLDVESTRKSLMYSIAWTARDPKLVDQAVVQADRWRELPQAIRSLVLEIAVDAKPEVFARILKEVRTEPDRTRRDEMYGALGSVRDPKRQLEALALVLDKSLDIRETISLLWGGSMDQGRAVARRFFKDNQAAILSRLPQDAVTSPIAYYAYLFTNACRADQRDEITAYVRKEFTSLPGGKRVVDQAIERMNQCIAKRTVLEPEIRGWLTGVKIPKANAPKDKTDEPEPKPKKKNKDNKSIKGAEKSP
ncbi:MAG: M1 family metallopeptidase [Deltaproteobacteria bacterium]|nr:M1 family metallopeptidase [Deltaproteobacteria bacterium]